VNEWLHIGADALVLIAVSITGFVVHTIRDSILRVETKTDENTENIALIKGKLGMYNQ
jgi:hypothetical protein